MSRSDVTTSPTPDPPQPAKYGESTESPTWKRRGDVVVEQSPPRTTLLVGVEAVLLLPAPQTGQEAKPWERKTCLAG